MLNLFKRKRSKKVHVIATFSTYLDVTPYVLKGIVEDRQALRYKKA